VRTLLLPAPLCSGDVEVAGDEAVHGLRVLRLRPGEALRIADGAGHAADAVVTTADRRLFVHLGPVEDLPPDRLADLTVAVAPPKGDRWTDLVRGLTELGVGAILPLVCRRGERQPASLDRARRVATEALKQCRRHWLPRIGPPVDIPALAVPGGRVIICDPAGGPPSPGAPGPATLVVGPEGGLDEDEVAMLVAAGAERVRLAGPVLRIETAALAAAAVWAATWEHVRP
jgi:16S rRNA (uracil1498-N3)-methyltransferase